jgi:antitoxin (DNA-binding transcriptional repressor) of toxin-antitoxin stability system
MHGHWDRHIPELLRKVRRGQQFTITVRGEPVARLIPMPPENQVDASQAIDAFQAFLATHLVRGRVDIKALIEEGRS